ncbi:WhiB family transcriptional regulator [Streptomyces sp. JV185]|uniref:WhiB family transcriptional regulator n=1 Tax=Streptomyces sp. JV185 TaxID=858638 RepID=UPI002E78019C|nr:WhiB family transcriptional regulator [Streptomyces sp. JV185]MEE1774485.1 WhiB family transcriptional regulator [Streptomyces sp. JV185]
MKYEWMDSALCAQTDPDLWYPEGPGQHARTALRVCTQCPVRPECGEYAQDVEDASDGRRYGAWAGMSANARSRQTPATVERDRQIISLTAQGLSAAEIGARLDVTGRTVVRVRADHRQQQEAA